MDAPVGQRRAGLAVLCVVAALVLASCGAAHSGTRGASATSGPRTTTTTPTAPPTTTSSTSMPQATVTTSTGPPTPLGIQVGPGPQSAYSVQTQLPAGSCHYRLVGTDPLPDPRCTPGATNPQVTQATIASTICSSGYATSIRPPENVTEPEKVGSAAAYGYTGSFHTGEYDHLIPLEVGGDPNDPANLWLEPNDRADATSTYNSKDVLENRLHDLVCSGRVSLAAAQQAIATDWVTASQTYG